MDDDIDELMGREDLDLDNTERVDDSVEHTAEEVKEEVTKTEEGEETKEAEVSDDSEGEERAEEKEAQQTEEKMKMKVAFVCPLPTDLSTLKHT